MTSQGALDVRLRPLRVDDEPAARQAHAELAAEGFDFLLRYDPATTTWPAFVDRLAANRRGDDLPDGWVPTTFLVATVDGEIVGRTSIRHELNAFLRLEGGHVGYGVRPGWRRRGVATEILRQSLVLVRSLGIDEVLVTCDDDNEGSAAVIERCGGVLDSVVQVPGHDPDVGVRRYWIR